MNEQGMVVLVGAKALQLKGRLEALGYSALEWGPAASAGFAPLLRWVICSMKLPLAWCVVAVAIASTMAFLS